jgi:hypothetical protein
MREATIAVAHESAVSQCEVEAESSARRKRFNTKTSVMVMPLPSASHAVPAINDVAVVS